MKICIFTTFFYPEEFKVNDLAFELAKRGHEVTVVTAVPNYPQGKFFDGYSIFKRKHEIINGVEIFRLPVIPRGKGAGILLALNFFSHLFFAMFFTFFHALFTKYDVVFVHGNSPLTIGKPAKLMSRIQQIPMVFWVLDLWPESIVSASNFRNGIVLSLVNHMIVGFYKSSTSILVGSKGFASSIASKGNFAEKIKYFPNWAENVAPVNAVDIASVQPFGAQAEDDFIVMFAGNLGEAQDLVSVIQAAVLTKAHQRIKWVFLGEGRKKDTLITMVKDHELEKTVFFPGRFPLSNMPTFMSHASVLLFSLKDEANFNVTVPSKVQFYMSQSKPIVAMLNGDGAALISEARCGFSAPAGNYRRLAELIVNISEIDGTELNEMGLNGKRFYEEHFRKEDRIVQLESIFFTECKKG